MDAIYGGRKFLEVGQRKLAWHGLGELVAEGEMLSIEQAMNKIGLLYSFEKQPLAFKHPKTGEWIEITGKHALQAVLREPTDVSPDYDFISAVAPDYGIMQHLDIARALDRKGNGTQALSERFPLQTIGALYSGETLFMCMKAGDSYEVKGDTSPIDRYFLVTETKRGDGGLIFMPTDVRVVCANTLSMALKGQQQKVSFVHTKGIKQNFDRFIDVFNQLQDQQQGFRVAMNTLAGVKLAQDQLAEIVKAAYPEPPTPQAVNLTALERKLQLREITAADIEELSDVEQRYQSLRVRCARFRAETFQALKEFNEEQPVVANTAYAAIQAVAFFSDNRIGGKDEKKTALDVVSGHRANERLRATAKAMELAGVK